MTTLSAIIADDEIPQRDYLERMLKTHWPSVSILGRAGNGVEAIKLFDSLLPDLVFLDIRMPGRDGIEVAKHIGARARVVFVTAYDQYAITAFEQAAMDYLLKPVTAERLRATQARMSRSTHESSHHPDVGRMMDMLQSMTRRDPPTSPYLQWVRVGQDDRTELVPIEDAVYFQSGQKYTSLFTASHEHLLRMSLKELEASLDPNDFWRIHRGIIVNVKDIEYAKRDLRGRYQVTLKRRNEILRASQSYAFRFKQM
ncbi:MAG: LytTR family DNA-binding domain-containing protein [Pseudomonadota bacterium]